MTDFQEALEGPTATVDEAVDNVTSLAMLIHREIAWSEDDQPKIREIAQAIISDGYSRPSYEVTELGEDSNMWMVEGSSWTTHTERIRIEVASWVIDCCGVSDGMAEDIIPQLKAAAITFRDDWFWLPLGIGEEAELKHGDSAPANLPRFSGTLVTI